MPSNVARPRGHEAELGGVGHVARQHRRRLRPLQREQRAVVARFER